MANVGYYRFAHPFRTTGGNAVTGIRVFPPTADFSFTPRFTPEDVGGTPAVQFLNSLHPDIRGAAAEALATLKRNNIGVTLQSAGNGDTLAQDGLAFRIVPQDPAKAQDVTQALTGAGFVTNSTPYRYQSNTDAEAAAIAAMPSIPGSNGRNYRVIPGGTVWNRSAGAPSFANQVQQTITQQFGNQNTPGRRLALDDLPAAPVPQAPAPAAPQSPETEATRSVTLPASPPLIVLDPGHGRYISKNPITGELVNTQKNPNGLVNDAGAEHGGLTEVQLNDVMTARVALSMRDHNYNVRLTRKIDTSSPMLADISASDKAYLGTLNAQAPEVLPDRFNARVETGAGEKALHLSIHANSGTPERRGAEFFIHTDHKADGPSAQWAQTLRDQFRTKGILNEHPDMTRLDTGIIAPQPYDGMANQIRPGTGSPDRHVIRGLGQNIGGVVAELGYMSNEQDMARMRDPAQQKATAELIANATDRFQQARTQGVGINVQPTAPSSFSIRDDIAQPHVRQAAEQLSQWHKTLPQERQNPGFALQDPKFLDNPDNRQALLLHFKQDQNKHAGGTFAVSDPATQPMIGPKVTTALRNAASPQPAPAVPAAPAAKPATSAPAATPMQPSAPDPSGLVPKPAGKTTPEQRSERHTENGLRVLGITREGMNEQERSAALKSYVQGAGLPETASATQIGEQVKKDITALQTRMRDASQAEATQGHYTLGNFGPARDGVDGIAGAYTQGAAKQFAKAQGASTMLALVREPAAHTETAASKTPEQRDETRAQEAAKAGTPAGPYLTDRFREREQEKVAGSDIPKKPAQAPAPDFITPKIQQQVTAANGALKTSSGGETKPVGEPEPQNNLPKVAAAQNGKQFG